MTRANKFLGIHQKSSFACVEDDKGPFIFVFPYGFDDKIRLEHHSVDEFMALDGWYSFNKPRYIKDISELSQLMKMEFYIECILKLADAERKSNQGKLIFNNVDLKYNKIMQRAQFINSQTDNQIEAYQLLIAITHIHGLPDEYKDKILLIRDLIQEKDKEISRSIGIPSINLESHYTFSFTGIIDYLETDLVHQRRFEVARQTMGFFQANKEPYNLNDVEIQKLTTLYQEIREQSANARGYSTYSTPKKQVKGSKRFISSKK